ncbi:MAG: U32 family peptidase [Methanobacteriaceae archaeon]|jgi:putative protease|nr:U32 family peptidase [Candidatus Methanorudis spinitermitis]
MKIPELLAPVGSIEHLKVAIFSGASSIYLSGKKFGARQYAMNLSFREIKETVKFAHLYNVKVYVTVNTLIKEEEILNVIEYLLNLYKIGADAVLIQDIGIVKLIREIIPNLAIHSSTQMNIQNKEGIKWAVANGIKRVVLPRELNLDELKEITDFAHENGVEVEIFIHGALCYSYSGRCLFSSFKGGRSGNRGICAQPCREKYQIAIKSKDKGLNSENKFVISNNDKDKRLTKKITTPISNEKYFLSLKDLSLFNELEAFEKIGVDSLKIEGRMRNVNYVAIVVNSYRKLLNKLKYMKNSNFNKYNNEFKKKRKKYNKFKSNMNKNQLNSFKQDIVYKKAIEDLKLVFNREFTTGHLLNQSSDEILNIESPGDSGLYIGKVDSFSKKTGEIAISLDSNLITIPEKGDGLLIKGKKTISKKNKKNKNNHNNIKNSKNIENSYGLEISKNPILKVKPEKNNQILIIKKVKENKEINIDFDKNSKVYLSKRKAISDYAKNLVHDNSKQIIRRSRVFIQFDIVKSNYPIIKGKVILANGKKIDISKKSNIPWEIAKNKPITKEQLKKQLFKIGNLPLYIEKISINYKEDLFAPISEINKLRREFFKDLENSIIISYLPDENEFQLAKNNFKKFQKIKNKLAIESKVPIKDNIVFENKKLGKNYEVAESKIPIVNDRSKKNNENSLAIYLNNLNALKSLNEKNNVYNRVYLEIPPKNQYLSFEYNNDKEKRNKIDISYIINYMKEALAISKDQKYELVWKWPDIAHQKVINDFIKALAILKKLDMNINVMTGLIGISNYLKKKFEVDIFGFHPLNIYNSISILKLNEYKLLTISPELSKKDIANLNKEYLKSKDYNMKSLASSNIRTIPLIEVLVHGNIELLVSKNDFISKKLLQNIEKIQKSKEYEIPNVNEIENSHDNELFIVLKDLKNNEYPIKKDIYGEDRILLNSKDFSLINHIFYLKSIGIENFAIDGRWKSIGYIKNVGTSYKKVIDCDDNFKIDLENIKKKSSYFNHVSEGNFINGLKSK